MALQWNIGRISIPVIPLAVILIALIASTVLQGYYSERWSSLEDPAELIDMAARVNSLPERAKAFTGDWTGREVEVTAEQEELLEQQLEQARVSSHVNMEFVNAKAKEKVTMTLVCGPGRHIVIHTPDQCMVGAGFKMRQEPRLQTFMTTGETPTSPEFLGTLFERESTTSSQSQHIYWAWGRADVENKWFAPEGQFAQRVALMGGEGWYKLYVTTTSGVSGDHNSSASKDFIRDVLPQINEVLFEGDVNTDDEHNEG